MRTWQLRIIPAVFKFVGFTHSEMLRLWAGVGQRFCLVLASSLLGSSDILLFGDFFLSRSFFVLVFVFEKKKDISCSWAWSNRLTSLPRMHCTLTHQCSVRLDSEVSTTRDNTYSLIPSLIFHAGTRDLGLISFLVLLYSCSSSVFYGLALISRDASSLSGETISYCYLGWWQLFHFLEVL